jgi:hypothetical protein
MGVQFKAREGRRTRRTEWADTPAADHESQHLATPPVIVEHQGRMVTREITGDLAWLYSDVRSTILPNSLGISSLVDDKLFNVPR